MLHIEKLKSGTKLPKSTVPTYMVALQGFLCFSQTVAVAAQVLCYGLYLEGNTNLLPVIPKLLPISVTYTKCERKR